jgi:hypothetical protein
LLSRPIDADGAIRQIKARRASAWRISFNAAKRTVGIVLIAAIVNCAGASAFASSTTLSIVSPTINAAQFSGANYGARIQNALKALPAAGGVVDARGITGEEYIRATITIPEHATLLLGKGWPRPPRTSGAPALPPTRASAIRLSPGASQARRGFSLADATTRSSCPTLRTAASGSSSSTQPSSRRKTT